MRIGADGAWDAGAAERAQKVGSGEQLGARIREARGVHLHHTAARLHGLGRLIVERLGVEAGTIAELLHQIGVRHAREGHVGAAGGLAPHLEIATPYGIDAHVVPARLLSRVVEGPAVKIVHAAEHVDEVGEVERREVAVLLRAEPVDLAAGDDLHLGMSGGRCGDIDEVIGQVQLFLTFAHCNLRF